MASIPGVRFDITGASGSQGFLSPKDSWRAYFFPRGAYAKQASTGAVITFDSTDVASRYAANDWVQVGLSTDNILQVAAVGGNSINVGSNVTVAENDRVLLIGSTEPTVTGGSATYTTPQSVIYERDDDGSDTYTNSMITSDSNGQIHAYADQGLYDVLIQDGNQSNQGYIADVAIGAVEGVSTEHWAYFGASVTMHAALGVTGWATFGASMTVAGAIGVTGDAELASNLDVAGNLDVDGDAVIDGVLGVTGAVSFGASATVSGSFTVSNNPRVRLFMDVDGQSISDGSNTTILWSNQSYDVGDMYDPAGSSSFISAPEDGTYLVIAGMGFSSDDNGLRHLFIRDYENNILAGQQVNGVSLYSTYLNVSAIYPASSGNTFSVQVFQNSGSTLNISGLATDNESFFSAIKIS